MLNEKEYTIKDLEGALRKKELEEKNYQEEYEFLEKEHCREDEKKRIMQHISEVEAQIYAIKKEIKRIRG